MKKENSVLKASVLSGYSRSSYYYRPKQQQPVIITTDPNTLTTLTIVHLYYCGTASAIGRKMVAKDARTTTS